VAAPEGHSAFFLVGNDPVPVVLDLVQPVRARGWPLDEERLTGEDETTGGLRREGLREVRHNMRLHVGGA
jgi:hypothetical protein